MSRLSSAARAHFYPAQPTVVAQIAAHIAAPHGGRVWDPCAGEGAALAQLASLLNLEPFGNELHQGRATTAAAAVDSSRQQQPHAGTPRSPTHPCLCLLGLRHARFAKRLHPALPQSAVRPRRRRKAAGALLSESDPPGAGGTRPACLGHSAARPARGKSGDVSRQLV